MALWRMPTDFAYGTLSVAAAIGDTSLSSSQFSTLPSSFTTSAVMPMVLLNSATQTREVVWVTAHTASATSVTVVRGKEGTAAAAWPSGTQWICAPTAARDGLPAMSTSALNAMTDQHVGMRALNTDSSSVWEWTFGAGWQAEIGACKPSDVGTTASGGSVPTAANVLTRMGCVLSATPSAGLVSVTFPAAFPNGFIGAAAGSLSGSQFVGDTSCESGTTTGMSLRPVQNNGTTPGVCSLFWLAFGW